MTQQPPPALPGLVFAEGERPIFAPGDAVRILTRSPIGHYRLPVYLRGKAGTVETVIEPAAVDNERDQAGYFELMEAALEELFVEKGYFGAGPRRGDDRQPQLLRAVGGRLRQHRLREGHSHPGRARPENGRAGSALELLIRRPNPS